MPKAKKIARSKSGSVDPVTAKSRDGKSIPRGAPGTPIRRPQAPHPSAQKTIVKQCPTKAAKEARLKKGKKPKSHQQYDLIVTIDLVEYGLSDDLVSEFKEAFMLFDKDEDGMIDTSDLGVVMRSLGQRPTDSELRKMINEIETCSDGTIEFNEFLQMMSKKLKTIGNGDELREAFKVFDKKKSGYLTSKELRHVMTSMGEKLSVGEVEDMIKDACPDNDGKVKYEDFVKIIERK
ncbi:unnamed protein product, partial [Meganyctiphanes norvegica]